MKYHFCIFILLVIFSISACQVAGQSVTGGCISDDDCKTDRLCVDKVCVFTEDLSKMEPADDIAQKAFRGFLESDPRIFAVTVPSVEDLDWGFDWLSDHDSSITNFTRRDQLLTTLEEDFYAILKASDFSGAEYIRFEPGQHRPIPKGTDKALLGLESLDNSKIIYSKDGQEHQLNIRRIIRFRGRWKIFKLTN